MNKEIIVKIPDNINVNIGIPGRKGNDGNKGDKGDPFRYEDFTAEQLAALKGEKGDKGEDGAKGEKGEDGKPGAPGKDGKAFTYEDFTPDQLAALKGEKGDPGEKGETGDMPSIPNTIHLLREKYIYLPGEDLDTVLTTILNTINDNTAFMIPYESAEAMYPFEVDTFNEGDENITVHACLVGSEMCIRDSINYLGRVVASKNVEKVKEDDTPALVYQEDNPNMKLSVKGTKAVLEFIQGGRNELRSTTLKPLQNTVKRLIIDLANIDRINDYVSLPFVPEKIQIINYKANNLNLSFQGDYYGMTKIVSEKPIPYHTLNSNGEYEVSSLNGKSIMFSDNSLYINDAL